MNACHYVPRGPGGPVPALREVQFTECALSTEVPSGAGAGRAPGPDVPGHAPLLTSPPAVPTSHPCLPGKTAAPVLGPPLLASRHLQPRNAVFWRAAPRKPQPCLSTPKWAWARPSSWPNGFRCPWMTPRLAPGGPHKVDSLCPPRLPPQQPELSPAMRVA